MPFPQLYPKQGSKRTTGAQNGRQNPKPGPATCRNGPSARHLLCPAGTGGPSRCQLRSDQEQLFLTSLGCLQNITGSDSRLLGHFQQQKGCSSAPTESGDRTLSQCNRLNTHSEPRNDQILKLPNKMPNKKQIPASTFIGASLRENVQTVQWSGGKVLYMTELSKSYVQGKAKKSKKRIKEKRRADITDL